MIRQPKPHTVVLFIDASKVINNVDNKVYILSKTLPKETDAQLKALLTDISQERNRSELGEMVLSSMTDLYEFISGYIKKECCRLEIVDNDTEINDCKITLTVPPTFQSGASEALRIHAQEYISASVMRKWLGIVLPELAEMYDAKVLEAYSHIINIMQGRTKMPTIKCTVL